MAASPKRANSDDGEEQPVEFGSPMFDNETVNPVPEPPALEQEESNSFGTPASHQSEAGMAGIQRDVSTSAFQSFNEGNRSRKDDSPPIADELPVKEQIDTGNDSSPANSYLQLDLEAAGSARKVEAEEVDFKSSNKSSGSGAMDALRTSLAAIWNSKPHPRLSNNHSEQPKRETSKRRISTKQYSPVPTPAEKASRPITPDATSTQPKEESSEAQAEAESGAMDSLRSSLMMIWNSKPKLDAQATTQTKPDNDVQSAEAARAEESMDGLDAGAKKTHDPESQAQERPDPRGRTEPSEFKRVFSEDSSDASSYRRTQKKKTRRCDGLSARQRPPPRQARDAMGRQYLAARGRSQSRERTITPIPSNEDLNDTGLLGDCRGSYDSTDDFPLETLCVSDAYRCAPRYNTEAMCTADPLAFRKPARVAANPSSVQPTPTTETEDSFINAALQARNMDDVVVIYSATPDKRDWHPPEQERKEHDTMVRAILERPSLIDKSIRESNEPRYWDWREVRKWVLIGLAMLVLIAIIAGCLTCGITGSCGRRTADPLEEIEEVKPLVLNLPLYTQEALKSLHTAQTKAYFWLESDPYRNSYSHERKLQRFALATLYYSTKIAQNWTVSTSWLSYDIHECYWFSSYEGMDVCQDDEITHLVLKKNNLRGNIPPELALLTSLVELDLSRNVLIGPIPEELVELSNLEVLWLEKNELNGEIPSRISSMTSLTNLALATNDLKGTIPSEVGTLTNLKKLRLFYNYLTGSVPTELGLLRKLEVLDVDVNHLSGTIPPQLGQLEQLKELWLDWNSFVGPLPSELGLLSNLVKLYLGRAFVEDELRDEDWRGSGDYEIPSELGQLNNLQELYLDNNNLTGVIPRELSELTNLERATLDNNLLTDSISPGICALFGGELESLSIDCGEVLCSCGCTCV